MRFWTRYFCLKRTFSKYFKQNWCCLQIGPPVSNLWHACTQPWSIDSQKYRGNNTFDIKKLHAKIRPIPLGMKTSSVFHIFSLVWCRKGRYICNLTETTTVLKLYTTVHIDRLTCIFGSRLFNEFSRSFLQNNGKVVRVNYRLLQIMCRPYLYPSGHAM